MIKKTIFICCILTVIPIAIYSQPELKKRSIVDKKNKIEEIFFVLKTNKEIKQGEYQKYMNGKLIEKGFYENNLKQIWNFYDFKSHLTLKYDFAKDTILELNLEEKDFEVYLDKNTKIKVDRPAIALISLPELIYFVATNTKYPVEALENSIQGNVEIAIEIDKNGKILKYDVLKSVNPILDNEALRVVKSIPESWKWLPAIENGNRINTFYVIPVNFILQ